MLLSRPALLALLLGALALATAARPAGAQQPDAPLRTDADVEGRFVRALAALWADRPDDAVRDLGAVLDVRPGAPAALDAMAAAYVALDRSDEALYYAEQAATAAPDDAVAQSRYGALLRDAGQPDRAIAAYEAAAEAAPRDASPLAQLADLYAAAGRPDDERRALGRLVRLADSPAARLRLSALDADRATEHLARAVALAPNETALAVRYAEALRADGRTDDAARVLAEARDRHPSDPALRAAAGSAPAGDARAPADRLAAARERLEMADEDPDALAEAERLIASVLADEAGRPDALLLGGRIAFAAGDYASASSRFAGGLRADPTDIGAWRQGLVAHARALHPDAARLAEDALLVLAGQPGIDAAAAEALLAGDRPAAALVALDDALALSDAPDLHALRATALVALDRPGDARGAIGRAAGADPVLRALADGDLARAAGDLTTARAAWQRGLDLDPGHAGLSLRLDS